MANDKDDTEGQINPFQMQMISQPLLTEEGFVNEACINELNAAIKNMPETWERLANDPEWSKKEVVSLSELMGALGKWMIRQYSGVVPVGFNSVIGYANAVLKKSVFKDVLDPAHDYRSVYLSLCDINKLLWDTLGDLQAFKDLNDKDVVGEHWLDLGALLHNVCIDIRQSRRENADFDRRFKEEHEKEHPEWFDDNGKIKG